jgi:hypothetical protein
MGVKKGKKYLLRIARFNYRGMNKLFGATRLHWSGRPPVAVAKSGLGILSNGDFLRVNEGCKTRIPASK